MDPPTAARPDEVSVENDPASGVTAPITTLLI